MRFRRSKLEQPLRVLCPGLVLHVFSYEGLLRLQRKFGWPLKAQWLVLQTGPSRHRSEVSVESSREASMNTGISSIHRCTPDRVCNHLQHRNLT